MNTRPVERPLVSFRAQLRDTHVSVERWMTERSLARCERLEPIDTSGSPIFVKVFDEHGNDVPERLIRLFAGLNEQVAARPSNERRYQVPRLVAYGHEPSYVSYEWVAGSMMSAELRARSDQQPDTVTLAETAKIARRAGGALCQLHRDLACAELREGRLPVKRPRWASWLAALRLAPRRPSPAIVDVGPWNVVLNEREPPTFIDLDVERMREIEYDVGWFAYFLIDKSRDVSIRTSLRVVTSFVDGYVAMADESVSQILVYTSAAVSGVSRNVVRLWALRPTGSDRRWILRRAGLSLLLVPVGVIRSARRSRNAPV